MKDVQMTFKVSPELREQFMGVARQNRMTAAQLLQAFMRKYVSEAQRPILSAQDIRHRQKADDVARANVEFGSHDRDPQG